MIPTAARADVQGFVTSGYGHLPHGAYLMLEVTDRDAAKAWLQQVVPRVTTAESWRPSPGERKVKPPRALNVATSRTGLAALGLSKQAVCTFPAEFLEGIAEPQRARILGDTGDSAPETWQVGGPANPAIDLVLILNAAAGDDLDAFLAQERAAVEANGGVREVALERGARPPSGKEPFGFRDGIGQPRIEGIVKDEAIAPGEFILGYQDQFGFFPPSPVVAAAEDPEGVLPPSENPYHRGLRDFGRGGSFLVYRKLRQDVAGFWRYLARESEHRLGTAEALDMVKTAAKMVGRWPSGAPLVLAPERDDPALADEDEFLYRKADPRGLACPFGAHVRRTNPRDMVLPSGEKESLQISDRHRILRRATAFGGELFDASVLDRLDDHEALAALTKIEDDGVERGIHFFAVNASIKGQFELVQQEWCNNPRFNDLSDNSDPLLGGPEGSRMVTPGNPVRSRSTALPRFITVRGGAYLFLPSLTALCYLST